MRLFCDQQQVRGQLAYYCNNTLGDFPILTWAVETAMPIFFLISLLQITSFKFLFFVCPIGYLYFRFFVLKCNNAYIHSVYSDGIGTHNLLVMSRPPKPPRLWLLA